MRPSVLLRFSWQHWESMTTKSSRKHHQPTEDNQEGSGERVEDIRSVVKLLLENQNKKEEENRDYRIEAEKREELRAIAAEERAEARRQADKVAEEARAEAREEAKA